MNHKTVLYCLMYRLCSVKKEPRNKIKHIFTVNALSNATISNFVSSYVSPSHTPCMLNFPNVEYSYNFCHELVNHGPVIVYFDI